jgi:hypothetical protein
LKENGSNIFEFVFSITNNCNANNSVVIASLASTTGGLTYKTFYSCNWGLGIAKPACFVNLKNANQQT